MSECLRILFLAANPTDSLRLKLETEYRLLRNKMHDNVEAGNCELRVEFAARPTELQSALLEYKPHVVHFAGHGNSEGICLETDDGKTRAVSADQLSTLLNLSRKWVRLVVLNACRSAPQTEMIGRLVDFVVGTNAPVADDMAVQFTAHFYRALAVGSTVREAFIEAKDELKSNGAKDQSDLYELLTRSGADESKPLLPPLIKGDTVSFESNDLEVRKGVIATRIRRGADALSADEERPQGAGSKVEIKSRNVKADEFYIATDYRESN
jgi:hypothetical protein